MLTPSFDVSQDDIFVTITLRVPFVKISDAEIHYEGCEFRFYCKPYFLHLNIPGYFASDGCEKSSYDVDTGTVLIHLPKRDKGQFFPNLGMLTTLLPRKPSSGSGAVVQPVMEVLGQENRATPGHPAGEEEEEEVYDWRVEQAIPSDNETYLLTGVQPYGFARKHRGVFLKLKEAGSVIIDCPDPDHMTSCERRLARVAHEEASFNSDHYLADLMDNDYVETLLAYKAPWKSRVDQWQTRLSEISELGLEKEPGPDIVPFSSAQRDQLKALPNREYLLDKAMKRCLYLGLVDIIYAYAYQHRTTEGEFNVESSWTLCRLSSTLCWLEEFHGTLHDVVHASIRRTLCYPLYRHWKLALTVLQDTRDLFRLGRRQLLSCILECIATLNTCDPYYLLNDLYLTDYAIWLQTASVKHIQGLAEELDEVKVEPGCMGWELEELGEAALLVLTEQEGEEDSSHVLVNECNTTNGTAEDTMEALLTNQMQAMHLQNKLLIEELNSTCASNPSKSEATVEGSSAEGDSSSGSSSEGESSSGSSSDGESSSSSKSNLSSTSGCKLEESDAEKDCKTNVWSITEKPKLTD